MDVTDRQMTNPIPHVVKFWNYEKSNSSLAWLVKDNITWCNLDLGSMMMHLFRSFADYYYTDQGCFVDFFAIQG